MYPVAFFNTFFCFPFKEETFKVSYLLESENFVVLKRALSDKDIGQRDGDVITCLIPVDLSPPLAYDNQVNGPVYTVFCFCCL